MHSIENWLENIHFEESRLTLQEKESFINTTHRSYNSDDDDTDTSSIYYTVNRATNKPLSTLSLPNIIESNSKSAPTHHKDTFKLPNIDLTSAPVHDLINAHTNTSISNRLSNLHLTEDKSNAGREHVHEEVHESQLMFELSLEDDNESLILNELPNFQNNEVIINSELQNDSDVIFFKDFNNIDTDEFVTPRTFQNHVLKRSNLNSGDKYLYFKNNKCPSSSSSNISNYKHYRYSRLKKMHGKTPLKPELLCRLCYGQNWISKLNFKTHLAFSHGILIVNKVDKIYLLPKPKSLFMLKSKSFKTYYVKCNDCPDWIKLGNSPKQSNHHQPKKQGLYYNYFLHYVQKHKDH